MATQKKILLGIAIAMLVIFTGFNLYWTGRTLLVKYQAEAFNKGIMATRNSIAQQIKAEGQLRVNINGEIITLKPEKQKRR